MLTDTNPDAEKVQLDLIRKASVAKRISLMRSFTSFVINLSRQGIAQANPGMNEREIELRWAELHYGKRLAAEVRDYLEKASHDS
ncbi:MAG: hypothetical protein IT426_19405 [Pirellulales bacterium]|nr:hypothetical protein [Pirellulales bacterium]